MGNGPAPFSDIGRRARDLLTKDYNYDQKFSMTIPSSTGMGLTATGLKRNQFFVGDLSTQYKSEKTTVDVKVDTYSSVFTKVSYDALPSTKLVVSFNVPDNKSGKLDVHYIQKHVAINSSIGLNPSPHLEISAAIGSNDVAIGGEFGFDTASSSFTKCNVGIGYNQPDFSAALFLADKGQTVKASYIHTVNPYTGTEVAAEMVHRLSDLYNSFSFGSIHKLDNVTTVKTRFSDDGRIAVLSQREWRPKSFVTVSAEYDTKATASAAPKVGLAIALKP